VRSVAAESRHAHAHRDLRGAVEPDPGGYFGVITQGFPQLVRVNRDVVKHDPEPQLPERGPILCQVRMLNESPLIPDFECLEQMISEETRAELTQLPADLTHHNAC
jgi:hypothetical protein